jgi:hypothetical protein
MEHKPRLSPLSLTSTHTRGFHETLTDVAHHDPGGIGLMRCPLF